MEKQRKASAAGKTLVAADNKDGGQEDPKEQIIFWQKQSDENSDPKPEQDKTDDPFHGRPSFFMHSYL